MPGPEFWGVITGIAAAITAIAVVANVVFSRGNTLYIKERDLPNKSVRIQRGKNGLCRLSFRVTTAPAGPEWVVTSISVHGIWPRRYHFLALIGEVTERDPYNQPTEYGPDGPWRRRIIYDPPVSEGIALIHSDTPDCWLSLNICLSSKKSSKSRLPVWYKKNE